VRGTRTRAKSAATPRMFDRIGKKLKKFAFLNAVSALDPNW
jgi:hypothetical protein